MEWVAWIALVVQLVQKRQEVLLDRAGSSGGHCGRAGEARYRVAWADFAGR